MLSEARQKKIMEKLNRAQKCSILGPQNLGSGAPAPPPGSAPAVRMGVVTVRCDCCSLSNSARIAWLFLSILWNNSSLVKGLCGTI